MNKLPFFMSYVILSPIGNDRILDDQNKLAIEWISENLVKDVVLELLSCHCSRPCTPELSSCIVNESRARVCADLTIAANYQT